MLKIQRTEYENTAYQNFGDASKALLKEKI